MVNPFFGQTAASLFSYVSRSPVSPFILSRFLSSAFSLVHQSLSFAKFIPKSLISTTNFELAIKPLYEILRYCAMFLKVENFFIEKITEFQNFNGHFYTERLVRLASNLSH